MVEKNTVESDTLLHRALADRSRIAILEALREAGEALDARQLALAVGLHVNTVRSHLRQLEGAGLVAARRDAQGKPGRPHIVFESTGRGALESGQAGAYRLLAEVLARSVASELPATKSDAETAARATARALAPSETPHSLRDATPEAVELRPVMRLLTTLGFDPIAHRQPDSDEIVMRSCPFEGLERESLEIACSVHRGLIRGALDGNRTPDEPTVVELHPEPGRCVARIAATG